MWDDDFEFQQDAKAVDDQSGSSRHRSDLARDDGETIQRDGLAENAYGKGEWASENLRCGYLHSVEKLVRRNDLLRLS